MAHKNIDDHNGMKWPRWLRFFSTDVGVLLLIALAKLLFHLVTSGGYGYFRDEFYYMAAGRRLDFGYVDYPPFVALVAALVRVTLGESLLALRFVPSLASAVLVFLAGMMARALGGGRPAQGMAVLAVFIAPQFLGTATVFTMDSFDLLFWAACLYVLILIFRYDRPRLWLLFGLFAGLGLLNKLSMLYLGLAVVVGMLLTDQRKQFCRKELYLGGLIALAFLTPYLAWNASHGWPTLEFWRNYGGKVEPASPLSFILQQIVIMNPGLFLLWLAGLVFTFRPEGKPYRAFGIAYLVLLVVFMIQNAKNYFLAPFYPLLFALGALMATDQTLNFRWRWLNPQYVRVTALITILFLPVFMPILPVGWQARYLSYFGWMNPKTEAHESGVFPQHLADRFGWEELTAAVARAYETLSDQERAQACILAGNYGEAGALEFFGRQYNLPPVISGHNNYYLWGPGRCTGDVLISVGAMEEAEARQIFEVVEIAGRTQCAYCMPYENNLPVLICHQLRAPIEQAWPMTKVFR